MRSNINSYKNLYSETILDLDWSSTPDMQSILAVGFAHRIDILCEQRMTYFDEGPGWGLYRTIDISRFGFEKIFRCNSLTFCNFSFTPYTINDSIWLAHGSFLIAAGPQMYLFSEPPRDNKGENEKSAESLMEHVARQNGPLDDYHPQMLLQCLLWGTSSDLFFNQIWFLIKLHKEKVELVKEIIVNLARFMAERKGATDDQKCMHLSVERFLQNNRRVPGVSHFYIFLSLDPIMMVYSVSINGNMEYYSMEQQLNHTSMLTQYLLKMMTYVVV